MRIYSSAGSVLYTEHHSSALYTKRMRNKKTPSFWTVQVVGCTLILFSLFIQYFLFPTAVRLYMQNKLYLYPGSEMWYVWEDIPIPVTTKFHLFNVTNPEEVKTDGAKPKLKEMGSYTYYQWKKRHNVTLNSNGTVTYMESDTFQFQPHLSEGSEDDLVTIINVPFVMAVSRMHSFADWRMSGYFMNMVLKQLNQSLFVTRRAKEILFEGYDNPLMTYAKLFNMADNMPQNGKFSLAGGQNGTKYGPISVDTGENDIDQIGRIRSYRGSATMTTWKDKYCNMINGTDGTLFPPLYGRRSGKVQFFYRDVCRSVSLEYEREVVSCGFTASRFVAPRNSWSHPDENPDNACYCSGTSLDQQQCPLSGLYNIQPCTGVPILLSYPHFFRADPALLRDVEGLKPDPEKHMAQTADMEPDLGYIIKTIAMVQANVELKPYQSLSEMRHVPSMVFPIMWISTEVDLPEEYAWHIRWRYLLPKTLVYVMHWIGLVGGAVTITLGIAAVTWKRKSKPAAVHQDEAERKTFI